MKTQLETELLPAKSSFLSDFLQLTKMRLALSVVFSSLAGYGMAADQFDMITVMYLFIGGYAMVGASNAYNQILEKDLDALMQRTKNRPLPSGRMDKTSTGNCSKPNSYWGPCLDGHQHQNRSFWNALCVVVCVFLYPSKNQNSTIGIHWSHSRSHTIYVGVGSAHRKFWD